MNNNFEMIRYQNRDFLDSLYIFISYLCKKQEYSKINIEELNKEIKKELEKAGLSKFFCYFGVVDNICNLDLIISIIDTDALYLMFEYSHSSKKINFIFCQKHINNVNVYHDNEISKISLDGNSKNAGEVILEDFILNKEKIDYFNLLYEVDISQIKIEDIKYENKEVIKFFKSHKMTFSKKLKLKYNSINFFIFKQQY